MTGKRVPPSFAFGPFVLAPKRQLLSRGEAPVRIGGRALDILIALVARAGDVVSKSELRARVWPDPGVEEGNLDAEMAALRTALGEGPGTPRYIATEPGGYRFVVPVRSLDSAAFAFEAVTAATPNHNLPPRMLGIIGRDAAIDALSQELNGSRLVSIVGEGGIGKTTVALAVAERAIGSCRDGVWLVELSPLRARSLVPDAIATAIGLTAHSANVLGPLCGFLRDRQVLLVLDNCEHVIDAVTACVDRILADAPGVRILTTSREPLRAKGERVRRLPGLGTPPASSRLNAQEAMSFPAVQLFAARARDRLESFRLSDADAPLAAEICRRLDGLALAIQLAATHVEAFGVAGVLRQLDDRFGQFTGRRDGPERHRTLAATLDWSYGLLLSREAALLRAVSVFASGFGVDGAVAVSNESTAEVAAELKELAAKSLLLLDSESDAVSYRLLETTRAYCLEHLRQSGDEEQVRHRHAEHVRAVLEQAAREWAERPAREWGAAYGRVLDDLRGALAWAGLEPQHRLLRIRLTVAGSLLWNHFSLTEECRVQVGRAVFELEAAELAGTATEMQLQMSLAGATMFTLGLVPETLDAMRRALDIAVQLGDTDYRLRCLRMIGGYQLFMGEHEAAIRTLETFAVVAAAEEPSALPEGETHLGLAEIYVGRLRSSRRRLERLYEHDLRDLDDPRFARFLYDRNVDAGNVLSNVQWLTGSPDTALGTAEATIEQAGKIDHGLSLSNALAVAACPIFYLTGRYQETARYVELLDEQVARHGILTWRPLPLFYRGALACAEDASSVAGVELLERAIDELRAINHWARMPYYLGVLGEAQARCGRFDAAEKTIQAGLERANVQGSRGCVPELLRVRASLLNALGRVDEAEALLLAALSLAQEIGALSWRLRAANDLAKLWFAGSRAGDALQVLSGVFEEFVEGFGTRDLVVAAGLLAALERRSADVAG